MSDSQWNYLGLSHNPFSDPQNEFFPGADREPLLGKIRKLSQWSRPILAVTGPHGVGKTCLFRALSSSLEAGVVAARVNGSLVSRAGDVLSALVQGYGVAAPSGADAPLLIELIIAHLKDQSQNERTSLVLVDDAHLLEQRAVDDLVNLAAAGARLAFFSEPQFVESLQRAVERNAETSDADPLLWQEMLLSPFSREQTDAYLEWRFAEAGYNGRMPFSEHQVEGVYRASEGFPGRLDFAANEQLMLMTVGGARTAGLPRKHIWLAAALTCVLGLVLWLWAPGGTDDKSTDDTKMRTVELPKPGDKSDPRRTGQRLESDAKTRTGGADSVAASGRESLDANGRRVTSAVTPPKPAQTLSRTVQPVTEVPAVVIPPPVPESRTVRVEPTPAKPAQAPPAPAKPVPTPTVAVAPKPTPAPIVTAKPEPVVVAKPEPAERRVPVADNPVTNNSDGSGPRSAAWLLSQSDAAYTIQLIGFGELPRARAYLAEQRSPGQFALFQTQSGDRVVHVVTYGVYATKAAADTAAANLPATVGKISPWVRPMRSIKGAIRKALQTGA